MHKLSFALAGWSRRTATVAVLILATTAPLTFPASAADELVLAANNDIKSAGIAKRHEIERVAQSSR